MQHYCEITTPKGVMRGFFHKPDLEKFPICLIFHGFTGSKIGTKFSYVQLARLLESHGVGTIRMDFLGSGDSDLSFHDMTFGDELSCARILLEEAKKMPEALDIYVVGHSMGGAIASELAKLYPQDIQKLCLWAPAFHIPTTVEDIDGIPVEDDGYDYYGFSLSQAFIDDMKKRDFYQDLDIYQGKIMIIHGTADATVPFDISKRYLQGFQKCIFKAIEGATHNYDSLRHIRMVLSETYQFLINEEESKN